MENNVDLPQEIFVFENLFLTQMRVHLETENGFHKGIFFFHYGCPCCGVGGGSTGSGGCEALAACCCILIELVGGSDAHIPRAGGRQILPSSLLPDSCALRRAEADEACNGPAKCTSDARSLPPYMALSWRPVCFLVERTKQPLP
jgi:hypothetical protein